MLQNIKIGTIVANLIDGIFWPICSMISRCMRLIISNVKIFLNALSILKSIDATYKKHLTT